MPSLKKDLVQAYFDSRIGRREFRERMAKLGVTAASAGVMLNGLATKVLAAPTS
jgi:hypothetical protein